MAIQPEFSRGRVDAAGHSLACANPSDLEWEIIGNWRAAHGYPLNAIKTTLINRAKKVDEHALIAQRLKRVKSIRGKLRANPKMALSQMQDIGGCRAILSRVDQVAALAASYDRSSKTLRKGRPQFHEKYDYITNPKPDGYRSVHFVYRYFSEARDHDKWNKLRVELQMRTRLQHSWATAVEVAETFTGQALRSNVGPEAWTRFFALMSTEFAYRERSAPVPGTPTNPQEWREEIQRLANQLGVEATLSGWSAVVNLTTSVEKEARTFLMVLTPETKDLQVTPYTRTEFKLAEEAYIAKERAIQGTTTQAVLVSVDSVKALSKAYPNYYLDTSAFIQAMHRAITLRSLVRRKRRRFRANASSASSPSSSGPEGPPSSPPQSGA